MKLLLLLGLLFASLAAQAQLPNREEARLRWLFDSTRQASIRRIHHRLDSTERAQALARGIVLPPAPVLPPIAPTPPSPLRSLYSKGPGAYRTSSNKTSHPPRSPRSKGREAVPSRIMTRR